MLSIEEKLIIGCLRGEISAQEELFNQYASKMMGVSYRYTRSLAEAEDILQDAFIKVFNQLPTFKMEGSLEGWVRRIVVNTAIDHMKKEKRRGEKVGLEEALELSIDHFSFIENRELIMVLKQLPDDYQLIINLHVLEGYSHREISQLLKISESNSRARLTRARACFKELLKNANKINEERCWKKTNSNY